MKKNTNQKPSLFIVLASLVMAVPTQQAQSASSGRRGTHLNPDANVNWREECRKSIGGRYLSLYDENIQATAYHKVITGKRKNLEAELPSERMRLATMEKVNAAADYDPQKASTADIVDGKVRTLEAQLAEMTGLEVEARKKATLATKAEASFREQISKVFKITEAKASEDDLRRAGKRDSKGYPYRIEYKADCPKYRFQCPLPPDHAKALKKMLPPADLPDACSKYSVIGQAAP